MFLRANFIEEVPRVCREEVLNSSVRIVDKIYEAEGYGLSGVRTVSTERTHARDRPCSFRAYRCAPHEPTELARFIIVLSYLNEYRKNKNKGTPCFTIPTLRRVKSLFLYPFENESDNRTDNVARIIVVRSSLDLHSDEIDG